MNDVTRHLPPRTLVTHAIAAIAGIALALSLPDRIARSLGEAPETRYVEITREDGETIVRSRRDAAGFGHPLALKPTPLTHAPGVVRIAVFGASVAAGVPFQKRFTQWHWLEEELEHALPEKHFEFVNFALAGGALWNVAEIERELPAGLFDVAIVTIGNTEFLDSHYERRIALDSRTWIDDTEAWLTRGEFAQYVRRVATAPPDASATRQRPPLPDIAAWDGAFEMRERIGETTRADMRSLLAHLQARQVPVLLVLPAGNIAHHGPQQSAFPRDVPASVRERVLEFHDRSRTALSANRLDEARRFASEAIELVPQLALSYRLLADVETARGDEVHTFDALRHAATFDVRPQWATRVVRDAITTAARERNVTVCDPFREFLDQPKGREGDRLFMDMCHLTVRGQIHVAAAMARSLRDAELLAPRARWRDGFALREEEIAEAHQVEGNVIAATAHLLLLAELTKTPDPAKLQRVEERYLRALEQRPADATIYMGRAVLEEARGHHDLAQEHYRRAVSLSPDSDVVLGELAKQSETITAIARALRGAAEK